MKKNHSLLLVLSLFLVSCDPMNIKQPDCECEEIKVTKEESIKCEAFPEEEKEITQYGLLKKAEWQAVENIIAQDHLSLAWPAWLQSCNALAKKEAWAEVCRASRLLTSPSDSEIKQFFYQHFTLYQALQSTGEAEGLVTGYYQPLLQGSRKKNGQASGSTLRASF